MYVCMYVCVCVCVCVCVYCHNVQFADYRASAPRGETLLLLPPQPIEQFIASGRVRAGKRQRRENGCVIRSDIIHIYIYIYI